MWKDAGSYMDSQSKAIVIDALNLCARQRKLYLSFVRSTLDKNCTIDDGILKDADWKEVIYIASAQYSLTLSETDGTIVDSVTAPWSGFC